MRIHQKKYIAVFSLLFGLIFSGKAEACSYSISPDPPMEYIVSRTEIVFLGRVIDKKSRIEKIDGERTKITSITFRMERLIKGKLAKEYRIEYYDYITQRDSCYHPPPDPKLSEKWVVFDGYDQGDDDMSFISDPDYLSWRHDSNKNDEQRLKEIDAAVKNQTKTFYGEVDLGYSGLPPLDELDFRAELWTSDSKELIKTLNVRKGQFQIDDYKPGSYILRLHSRKYSAFNFPEVIRMKPHSEGRFFADFKISLYSSYPEYKYFSLQD